jgi:hypothetical protein
MMRSSRPEWCSAVKRERQRDRVLEEHRDRRETAPVREPIGLQRNPYARADPEQTEARPKPDVAPCCIARLRNQRVDDMAE